MNLNIVTKEEMLREIEALRAERDLVCKTNMLLQQRIFELQDDIKALEKQRHEDSKTIDGLWDRLSFDTIP